MRRRIALLASFLMLGLLGVPAAALAFEPSPHIMNPKNPAIPGGKVEGTEAHVFEDACGLAIPPSSNDFLYVADYYHDLIDVFYPFDGYGPTPPGGEVTIPSIDPTNGPCGLVVDPSGNVYVNNWRENVVKFTPSSPAGVETPDSGTRYTPSPFDNGGNDTGVAINPSNMNIYVDTGNAVKEYTQSDELVQTIGFDEEAEYFGVGVSTYPTKNGYVYVADAVTNTIKVFDPATEPDAPIEEIDGAGTPQRGFDYLGESTVTVDDSSNSPSFGHIYVVDNLQHNASEHPEVALDEFNPKGAYRGQVSHWLVNEGDPPKRVEHWLTASEPTGVTLDEAGNLFVTSGNDEGSEEANEHNLGSVVYGFEPMLLSRPLRVDKAGSGDGLVESAPAGIYCGTACEAEYTKEIGEIVTLAATPDPHSAFVGWSGVCEGAGPVCHVTIEKEPVEVAAEFEALPQQSLTVKVKGTGSGTVKSEPAGIECASGTCTEGFNEGSTVTLAAVPDSHNRLVGWSGSGAGSCGSASECRVTMTTAQSVEAEFVPIPQKTLTVVVGGNGTVVSEPSGISCPSTCSEHFDEERVVTLVAAPALHQEIASWSGCTASPAANECTVAMDGRDHSVQAEFTPIRRRLTVTVVGSGSVSADHGAMSRCTGSCSAFYLDGELVRLTAAPAPGYVFAGWSGGLCGGTGVCEATLEADASVIANFAAPPTGLGTPAPKPNVRLRKASIKGAAATLTVNVSGPGTVSAAGRQLNRAHARAAKAGTVVLQVHLTKNGQRALAHSHRGKLSIPVAIAFAPAGGGSRVLINHVLTFRAGNGHHAGSHRHGTRRHGGHGKHHRHGKRRL